jgi:hypothetical protein
MKPFVDNFTPKKIESNITMDDLGLSAPGTRNISIEHQFKYYNYTEINKLNSEPEYRFEKEIEVDQMNNMKKYSDE